MERETNQTVHELCGCLAVAIYGVVAIGLSVGALWVLAQIAVWVSK